MSIPRYLQWLMLITLLFMVIFVRSPEMFFLPPLQVEDGVDIFAHFYQHRGASQIFRSKAGYIPLIANLMAYVSVRLPTRLIPYGIAWGPLFITLLTYSLFFSRRYRTVLASDLSRAVICLLFGLAPLSQFHLLYGTDYSIWNTFIILIMLSALPLPSRWLMGISCCLAINFLIWSHPLSILILPFQLIWWIKDRKNGRLYLFTLVNILLHQVLGVHAGGLFTELGIFGTVLAACKSVLMAVAMTGKIAFRSAFGDPLMNWAAREMWFIIVYWTVLVAVLAGVVFRSRTEYRALMMSLLYIIFSITFLNILSRGYNVASDIALAPRYAYLQTLAFIMLLVCLVDALSNPRHGCSHRRVNDSMTTSEIRPKPCLKAGEERSWTLILFVAMVLHYYLLNTQLGHYLFVNTKTKSPYLAAHPDNGRIVQQFFQELDRAEREQGSRAGIHLTATKLNDWPIEIDTRPAALRNARPPDVR